MKGIYIMKKKILAVAAALTLVSAGFTACGGNNGNESDIIPGNEAPVEEYYDYELAEDEELIDDEDMKDEAEIDLDDYFPDLADNNDNDDDEIDLDDYFPDLGDEPLDDEPLSDEGESSNPLRPMADAALADGEWPFMEEVTDSVIINEFFTLDPDNANYTGFIIMQCPMSASMSEVIIIEANDVDSAKADLDARRTKAIEIDAWYPHDQELAAASIVGTNGNYAYFIIGDSAEAAETALNAYINS